MFFCYPSFKTIKYIDSPENVFWSPNWSLPLKSISQNTASICNNHHWFHKIQLSLVDNSSQLLATEINSDPHACWFSSNFRIDTCVSYFQRSVQSARKTKNPSLIMSWIEIQLKNFTLINSRTGKLSKELGSSRHLVSLSIERWYF